MKDHCSTLNNISNNLKNNTLRKNTACMFLLHLIIIHLAKIIIKLK